MLNVTVTGLTEVIQRFSEMPSKVHDGLLAEITKQALDLQRYVVTEKLSGQVLNKITGKLASSIQHDVTDSGSSIIGRVYSNNSVSYAAAQEFGAQIPDRYPVNAKALHFFVGGQEVFAKFARGFTLRERSFLRSSLSDKKDQIIAGMTAAVQKATTA
jgi:hypothetical protein